MSYEFKKLSAVEAVETPADTANVLIEENGVIKRVPKSEVGGVKVASTAEVGQTLVVKAIGENGMPVEWECADAGTQPDWNESDETSMAYIQNKPFSKKISDTPIVEEQSLNPDNYYDYSYNGNAIYAAGLDWQLLPEFVEGKSYGVYFDGTLYTLTGSYYNNYYTTYYLGNGGLIYDDLPDNSGPFVIYKEYEPEYGSSNYIKFRDTNPHTFSIYEMELTKIESVFIPDEAFAQSDWEETDTNSTSYIRNKPFGGDEFVIVEKQTVTLNEYGHTETFLVNSTARTGETYQITFDGVNYIGSLSWWETDYGFDFTLQNGSNASFYIWNINSNQSQCSILFDSSLANTIHTIKVICLDKTTIKKIDEKFLPDEFLDAVNTRVDTVKNIADENSIKLLELKEGQIEVPVTQTTRNWRGLTYGNNKFIVLDRYNEESIYSDNYGFDWKLITQLPTLPNSAEWDEAVYGNGKFVAIAYNSNRAAYSIDGANWLPTSLPTTDTWNVLAYGNGKFVAIARTAAAYSEDGITWIPTTIPTGNWTALAYGNGKFVAIAGNDGTKAAYSEDGINWIQTTSPISAYIHLIYGNGKFILIDMGSINYQVGSDIAFYSEDGINWTQTTLPTKAMWSCVACGGGKFVAIANKYNSSVNFDSNIAAYSEDGVNWFQTTLPITDSWDEVAYGNGKFVAIGSDNIIIYSKDGVNWHDAYKVILQNNKDVTEKIKDIILDDISEQIQVDWSQSDSTSKAFIQNKPDVVVNGDKEMILTSSTEGSTKRFKITVDDSGAITATEVTE